MCQEKIKFSFKIAKECKTSKQISKTIHENKAQFIAFILLLLVSLGGLSYPTYSIAAGSGQIQTEDQELRMETILCMFGIFLMAVFFILGFAFFMKNFILSGSKREIDIYLKPFNIEELLPPSEDVSEDPLKK